MEHETQPDNRILVLDDEMGQRECCRRALARYGSRSMWPGEDYDLVAPSVPIEGKGGSAFCLTTQPTGSWSSWIGRYSSGDREPA